MRVPLNTCAPPHYLNASCVPVTHHSAANFINLHVIAQNIINGSGSSVFSESSFGISPMSFIPVYTLGVVLC